jgi:hypothetical protein
MKIFVFKCPECQRRLERADPMPSPVCINHPPRTAVLMKRDYQAEAANVNVEGLH